MNRVFQCARFWMLACIFYGLLNPVYAENMATWIKTHVVPTAQTGKPDLYLSGFVWHMPDGYSREDRSRLNAYAHGGGFGKRRVDEKGHEDILYAMVFTDSHYTPQPIAGYARQWFTSPIASCLSFGAGYTAAVSARSDAHYIPFPLVLPVATVRLNRFSLMGTGLPRLPGLVKGSVIFIWGRYEL